MKAIIGNIRADLVEPKTGRRVATVYVDRDAGGPRRHRIRLFDERGRRADYMVDGRSLRFSNGLIHLFAAQFLAGGKQ